MTLDQPVVDRAESDEYSDALKTHISHNLESIDSRWNFSNRFSRFKLGLQL